MSSFYRLLDNVPNTEEPVTSEEASVENPQAESQPEINVDEMFNGLPDDWRPQQKFASSEEELQFYREKYPGLWKHINSDEFVDVFLKNYGESIANKETEIKSAAQFIKALNADPEGFIAAHFPEYAEKLGVGKIYTNEEIGDYIDYKIEEEFGENWRDMYNPADLVRRNSISSQILKRSQEIEQQIENHNSSVSKNREQFLLNLANKQNGQSPAAVSEMQHVEGVLDQMVEQYYNSDLKDSLTQEEFIDVVVEAFQYKPTVKDIYRIMKYDNLVEAERKKAYEEGRKSMVNEFKKGSKKAAMDYVPAENQQQEFKPKSFMGLRLGDNF